MSLEGWRVSTLVPIWAREAGSPGRPWCSHPGSLFWLRLEVRLVGDTYSHWHLSGMLCSGLSSFLRLQQSPLHLLPPTTFTSPLPPPWFPQEFRPLETKAKKVGWCGKLLSSTHLYPEAKEPQSLAVCLKMIRGKYFNNPINYPATQASLYHLGKSTPSKRQIVSCSPLRKIPSASVDFSVMDSWKEDRECWGDQWILSEIFLESLLLPQNLALHSAQKKSKCCRFEEEILELGLKVLQLARDEWGGGNEQKHREAKASDILSSKKARTLSALFHDFPHHQPLESTWLSEYLFNKWMNGFM